jgi:hypothetical protein
LFSAGSTATPRDSSLFIVNCGSCTGIG